jgi:signal transduction histidine kinase
MQQMEQLMEQNGTDRRRVEAVVETLTTLRSQGESLAEVAHDARNMVTALGLYCDLLEEPGVLAPSFAHYGSELRLVASASRRLVEKLVLLDTRELETGMVGLPWIGPNALLPQTSGRWEMIAAKPIANLSTELTACRNLLAALAGPAITLSVDCQRGAQPVNLSGEELIRMLVNLVKNATEAMPNGGRIQISLRECPTAPGEAPWLLLTVEDNGPGIPHDALERIFETGYTTRMNAAGAYYSEDRSGARRGMGLSIARSLVEAAGGRMHAANRDPSGACFQIELPVSTF